MKLLVPLPLRRRVLSLRRATSRRWTTTDTKQGTSAVPDAGGANSVQSVRSATPGTVRVRRGTDPRAQEIEMDTTIARIMGSDWGDRSNQPVSFAMRLYWGIFIIVLANGAYTYFAGKDEKFLVDKVQKKVDEKLGRVETNEFVVMADTRSKPDDDNVTATEQESEEPRATVSIKPEPKKEEDFDLSQAAPPKSVFSSSAAPTPMPYFGAPVAQRPTTKADYERQLQQLRQRQARAREERKDPSSFRSIDEIDVEIKRIDQQKAQIKQTIKKL